ncbi:MAG: UDP-N-acetylglucosamine 2-epimerase [Sphingobacteriaceae bacterium]|nr:UDP-N-acetylglucosamine 2-epimerase [Sphingobacteriaceae bacterium]
MSTYYKRKSKKRNTVIITQHRRNNKEYRSDKILNICIGLASRYPDYNFLWILHPSSVNKKQSDLRISNFKSVSPLNPLELLKLYTQTSVIITDSGGMQEEGISLGIPVIITRNFTERQNGILKGKSFLSGSSGEKLEPIFERYF